MFQVRMLAEIEALVPGFTAAVAAFDEVDRGRLGNDEPPEPFLEWFEGNDRWANVVTHPDGNASVTVYEPTGQYCDEWLLTAGSGWLHVERAVDLLTRIRRCLPDAEETMEFDGLLKVRLPTNCTVTYAGLVRLSKELHTTQINLVSDPGRQSEVTHDSPTYELDIRGWH